MLTLDQDQADVIKSLPSLLSQDHRLLRVLTFFITPEFLHWFDEKNDFMRNALEHVYQGRLTSKQESANPGLAEEYKHIIESNVAVVDRLPFPEGKSSGYPGISLALSQKRSDRLLAKSPLEKRSADLAAADCEGPLISVKLWLPDEQGEFRKSGVLLRPANTLFANGLQSTMFVERWEFTGGTESGWKASRQGAREYVDHLTFNHHVQSPCLRLPIRKLTETREISMCMGNVISKLVGDGDSEPTSASLELEGKVSAFMKSRNATNGMLAVFALIKPKPSARGETIQGQALPAELLGYRKTAGVDDVASGRQQTLDSIRLAISNGAHLHRVTSGGGGWGEKQGLLSLEPALGFGNEEPGGTPPPASTVLDGKTGGAGLFWATKNAAEIARPGDMVEFYGIFWSEEEEQALARRESSLTALRVPDTRKWQNRIWANKELSNIIWGVVPPQDSHGPSTISTLGNGMITIPHQFGMLSENGMVLQTLDQEIDKNAPASFGAVDKRPINVTRIDAPHTVLTYSVPNAMATQIDHEGKADTETIPVVKSRKSMRDRPTKQDIPHHLDLEDSSSEQSASTHQEEMRSSPAESMALGGSVHATSRVEPSQRPDPREGRAEKSTVRIVKHRARVVIKKHPTDGLIKKHVAGALVNKHLAGVLINKHVV